MARDMDQNVKLNIRTVKRQPAIGTAGNFWKACCDKRQTPKERLMPKLTLLHAPGEHRRAALRRRRALLVITTLASMATALPALGEDGPLPPVERSLASAGLAHPLRLDRRRLASTFVPSIKMGAAVARMDGRGGPWSITAWASLTWPLERLPEDPVDRIRAQRRESLSAQVAEIWRRRAELRRQYESEPTTASRIDLEEADATLDALTDGDAP
jgi:hypothetical protein